MEYTPFPFFLERFIYVASRVRVLCLNMFRCPQRPEDGIRCPGTRASDDCTIPCGHWELDPGLLKGQWSVSLITEPSLPPLLFSSNVVLFQPLYLRRMS